MSDHNETRGTMSHDPNVMSDDLGPASGLDWSTVFQRPATVDPPREFKVGDRIQIGEQVVTVTYRAMQYRLRQGLLMEAAQ